MTTSETPDVGQVVRLAGLPTPRASEPPSILGGEFTGNVEVRVLDDHGQRYAYLVPASSGRRKTVLSREQGILLRDLQQLQQHAQALEQRIGQAVRHGRSLGLSWALLGFSTGLTDNGAKSRYGTAPVVPGELV